MVTTNFVGGHPDSLGPLFELDGDYRYPASWSIIAHVGLIHLIVRSGIS
jgi:hypothetical protein